VSFKACPRISFIKSRGLAPRARRMPISLRSLRDRFPRARRRLLSRKAPARPVPEDSHQDAHDADDGDGIGDFLLQRMTPRRAIPESICRTTPRTAGGHNWLDLTSFAGAKSSNVAATERTACRSTGRVMGFHQFWRTSPTHAHNGDSMARSNRWLPA